LHAGRGNDGVGALDVELLPQLGWRLGIARTHGQVVMDLQRDAVYHFNAFVFDVVDHHARQRFHIRSDDGHTLGPHGLQAFDQGAGAGNDRRGQAVGHRDFMQAALRLAVITPAHAHDGDQAGVTHDVHARIRQLKRAAVGVAVHRGQLFLRDRLHAHAAGMKREALGQHPLARAQHGRDFRFHGGVGTGHDQPDPVVFFRLAFGSLHACLLVTGSIPRFFAV
jgi:hypothetical protein